MLREEGRVVALVVFLEDWIKLHIRLVYLTLFWFNLLKLNSHSLSAGESLSDLLDLNVSVIQTVYLAHALCRTTIIQHTLSKGLVLQCFRLVHTLYSDLRLDQIRPSHKLPCSQPLAIWIMALSTREEKYNYQCVCVRVWRTTAQMLCVGCDCQTQLLNEKRIHSETQKCSPMTQDLHTAAFQLFATLSWECIPASIM